MQKTKQEHIIRLKVEIKCTPTHPTPRKKNKKQKKKTNKKKTNKQQQQKKNKKTKKNKTNKQFGWLISGYFHFRWLHNMSLAYLHICNLKQILNFILVS